MLQNYSGKRAIIIMNLGSPESTDVKDVKNYLSEFLMDGKVIDINKWLRYILVKGIIAPIRAKKSSKAYRKIWTDKGSPLVINTYELKEALQSYTQMPVEVCMRYGILHPSKAFDAIANKYPSVTEVIFIPLYPHYAMSSYETAYQYAENIFKKKKYPFVLTRVHPWYSNESYISALANHISKFININDYDLLLFSYHGIPERHIRKTDCTNMHCFKIKDCCSVDSEAHTFCYRHQVRETTLAVAKQMQLKESQFQFSFQSRLGFDEWLKPYTSKLLTELPKKGIKKLAVVCPAFVSDCLETLEEIAVEGKEEFLEAGGEKYTYIPCLNTDENWVKALSEISLNN